MSANKLCPVCTSDKTIEYSVVNIFNCVLCNHFFQGHRNEFIYNSKYLDRYKKFPTTEMSYLRISFLQSLLKTRNARILDIGCGDGAFIKAANKCGFNAFGFDVHDEITDIPRVSKLENDIWYAVTLFDSLEHMPNLHDIFKTNPDFFFISIPHLNKELENDINALKNWLHYKPDEHLHYFTRESICIFFQRQKYELVARQNIEDLIRNSKTTENIMTYVFKKY